MRVCSATWEVERVDNQCVFFTVITRRSTYLRQSVVHIERSRENLGSLRVYVCRNIRRLIVFFCFFFLFSVHLFYCCFFLPLTVFRMILAVVGGKLKSADRLCTYVKVLTLLLLLLHSLVSRFNTEHITRLIRRKL